jgi:hypothetical protein
VKVYYYPGGHGGNELGGAPGTAHRGASKKPNEDCTCNGGDIIIIIVINNSKHNTMSADDIIFLLKYIIC